MNFTFNTKINRDKWNWTIKQKGMFGLTFPDKVSITKEDEEKAKQKVREFFSIWNRDIELRAVIKRIYGYELPKELQVFIVTTQTSGIHPTDEYVYLSCHVPAEYVEKVIIHEFCHIAFLSKWNNTCLDLGYTKNGIQELKEVLTVINNFEFKNTVDKGYEPHITIREEVAEMWKAGKSIADIISNPEIIESVNTLDTIK